MQEAIHKVVVRVIDIAEQTVIDALEACAVDCNKSFIKKALKSALNGWLVSLQSEFPGVK